MRCHGRRVQLWRKDDVENEEQVAANERILVRRHAFPLHRLDKARLGRLVRVLHDVERGAGLGLLRRERLRTAAILENCRAIVDDKGGEPFLFAHFLACVGILRLRLGDVLREAVAIVKSLKLHPRRFLLERVGGHRRDDLARVRLDHEDAPVEMLDLQGVAAERLRQGDVALDVEVRVLADKPLVLLLLQHEDDVAWVRVRVLVRLLRECHLVTVWCALLDIDLKDLALLLRLEGLALAAAVVAGLLHLLDHRAHADNLNLHTASVAAVALRHTLLLVDHFTVHSHLLGHAVVELLQSDGQLVNDVLRLTALATATAAATAAAAEHHVEHIDGVATATLAGNGIFAALVVHSALLRIGQHLVRPSDLLESLRVAALVRVMLDRELAERLLDVALVSVLLDAEKLVVLLVVDLAAAAAAAAAAAREAASLEV